MFLRGINYDIGTHLSHGGLSRLEFNPAQIKKELEIIKNELHCDAIRISGYDVQRLFAASKYALELGMQVWFSPIFNNATQEEVKSYIIDYAKAAEDLKQINDNVIFVSGCEYSIFLKGFLKGDTFNARLRRMFSPFGIITNILGLRYNTYKKLNSFLYIIASEIRKHFSGKLTYASGTWEKINWELFDVIGIDHYRASYNKHNYAKQIQDYYKYGKTVAILEFGCCTYKGADEKGGGGWMIMEIVDGKRAVKPGYIRDESVQAKCIIDILDILTKQKILGAFVFTFITPTSYFNENPRYDFDMASYGIVRTISKESNETYKGLPWIPKEAFYRLSKYYQDLHS